MLPDINADVRASPRIT